MELADLPALNAILNSIATLLLVSGLIFIKRGSKRAHITCMVSALVVSAAFLTSYLIYHYNFPTTKFAHGGLPKVFYFLILFGLGQINSLFFQPDPEDAHLLEKQPMAQMAPNPAQQNPMMAGMQPNQQNQPKNIFKTQIESIELIEHQFALADCPKHALNRLKHVLGEK